MRYTITYDDTRLQRLFDAMSPRMRAKAMRGALRKEARRVRQAAVKNLRTERARLAGQGGRKSAAAVRTSNRELEKGIRTVVSKKTLGFRVTVGTARGKGFYKSRRFTGAGSREVPVLIWLEDGTALRVSSRSKIARALGRGKNRGRIPSLRFMEKTRSQESANVTEGIRKATMESVEKTARKYGCTV